MVKGKLRGHRDFKLLWGGETVSELGSQVSLLAIPLLAVRTLHATTFQVGLLTAASTAAFLIVGLPAGVWVDRIRRHWVMIAADLGRVLALGSIPVAFALNALTMVQLIVVVLVTGILTVFFDVAYQSYLPSLVGREHLVEGNAKLTGSAQVASVAGPSIAGGMVQAIGSSYAVVVDSLSFLVSALAVAGIRTPEPKPVVPEGGHPSLRHDMAEGLRFVFHNPCCAPSPVPPRAPIWPAGSRQRWRWSSSSVPCMHRQPSSDSSSPSAGSVASLELSWPDRWPDVSAERGPRSWASSPTSARC
jgi:MFS family permease